MVELSLYHFSKTKPATNQTGYYYVLHMDDRKDLSKVEIALIFYPTEILEQDIKEIPYMTLLKNGEGVSHKDYCFGPEVSIGINLYHLELLLEAINEDTLPLHNADLTRIKEKLKIKMSGKEYGYVVGKGILYEIEERDDIIIGE